MIRKSVLAGLLLASVFAVPAQAQDAAFSVTGSPDTLGNPPFTLGYAFTLSEAFTASGLGIFDAGGDGLASVHEIGLWDSGGTLLASTSITGSSGSLIDGFRYNSISSLSLAAGTYTIGSTFSDGLDPVYFFSPVTSAPGFTYDLSRFATGAALANPTNADGRTGYFGPNLLLSAAVPEPATWALLLLGFAAIGGTMRAKQRKQVVSVSYS